MKRFVIGLLCLFIGTALVAQDDEPESQPKPKSKQTKEDKKAAKRQKQNQMLKLEEEGQVVYAKHNLFGIKINNDGYGLSYEIGKAKTPYKSTIFQFEFNEKKHVKENKQSSPSDVIGGGFVILGNPFIYGKQNNFYQLKLGIGQQIMIGGKGNRNGVGVYGIFAGGFSAGFMRPYYIEVESPVSSGIIKQIKYTPQDSADFLNPVAIVGGTGLSKGWGELKFIPGVHAKTALRFDLGRFNKSIFALEVGFNFEYYTQKVVQMVNVEGKNFFANGYLSVLFGGRK